MNKDKDPNENNTRLVEGKLPLSIKAGGGMFAFGGVGIYQPQNTQPSSIGLDLTKKPEAFGHVFSYDDVARVIVNDETVWVNRKLPDAPSERQDILVTGKVKIEFFDRKDLNYFIEEHLDALKFLGLNL